MKIYLKITFLYLNYLKKQKHWKHYNCFYSKIQLALELKP
jgi:hypothetical protein